MPKYNNLSGTNLQSVQKAVQKAGTLLANAKTRLSKPDSKMNSLLGDAFGIVYKRLSDNKSIPVQAAAVMTISNVLTKITTCMANSTIVFEPNPPANAGQFAAYVDVSTRRHEVFLTRLFFGKYSTVERASYLVHEYVHLAHWPHGHPGVAGEQLAVLFARTPFNIPPNQSVNNAYCYQYFVEWFADDFPG